MVKLSDLRVKLNEKISNCRSRDSGSTPRFSKGICNNYENGFLNAFYQEKIFCGFSQRILILELFYVEKNFVTYGWGKDMMIRVESDSTDEICEIKPRNMQFV